MQPRVRILRLEAQPIAAVQVIGKAAHICLESFPRREQLIFTTSHERKRLRRVLFHRLPSRYDFRKNIDASLPLVLICATYEVKLF